MANHYVERDRLQAALAGSLRSFAATAAPHVKRWAAQPVHCANFLHVSDTPVCLVPARWSDSVEKG